MFVASKFFLLLFRPKETCFINYFLNIFDPKIPFLLEATRLNFIIPMQMFHDWDIFKNINKFLKISL